MYFLSWKLSTLWFSLIHAYQSLCTLCCTEARSQSYQTFVCNSFCLTKVGSLFSSSPSFATSRPSSLLAASVSPLLSLYSCLRKSELRPQGIWDWGGEWDGVLSLHPCVCGSGRWTHYLCFARLSWTEIFHPRFPIQDSTEFSRTEAEWPAFLTPWVQILAS